MSRPFDVRCTARSRRGPCRSLVTLAVAASLVACDVPNFEGPQIQEPPQGFLLTPDSYQQRRLFPDRELVFHAAWVESVRDFSTIFIDGHRGALGIEDAITAREEARRVAIDPDVRFGEVQALRVDGRDAWGWSERVESPTRGLVWVAYRAIIPYDSVTYAIEFYSGEPSIKRAAPDTLTAVISNFAIGETTYNLPLIAVLIGLVLFGVSMVQSRRRARTARMKSINLVKVPKKPTPETPGSEAAPAAPTTPAPAPAPPRQGAPRPSGAPPRPGSGGTGQRNA